MSSTTGSALAAPSRSFPVLSDRAAAGQSSAIRDLLEQAKRPGMISLAGGLPDATSFPNAELADIAHRVLERDVDVLQYGPTAGDEQARAALANLFGPGTDGGELAITTGSQQALDLIARSVVNPGDQVVAGDPEYLGALQVFGAYGADVQPIAIDAEGINTEQLEDALKWGMRPTCCYVVPTFHNPTGSSLSAERRSHLHELAARYGFLVIEDDPYRELYYDEPPAAATFDPDYTVRLRSTSKTLAPGLRIGALAGPAWLRDAVVTAKQSVDLHTSTLSQAVVAEALMAPWYPTHLETIRSLYRSKRDTLVRALDEAFDGAVTFDVPRGGMFLWARFDQVADTTTWLNDALEQGVCFVPGAAFAVTRDLTTYARFSFATGSPADLTEAVNRLRRALK